MKSSLGEIQKSGISTGGIYAFEIMLAVAKMSSKKAVPICIPANSAPVPLPTLHIVSRFNIFAHFSGRK